MMLSSPARIGPKNYADAEGLLYRQNDKLLRLIQFVQKICYQLWLVMERKLIYTSDKSLLNVAFRLKR